MGSLRCKLFRGKKTSDGSSILPGPDTEKIHQAFQDSFQQGKSELVTVKRQLHLLKEREQIRKMKNDLLAKRKTCLERRLKEDAEGKQELEQITQAELAFCARLTEENEEELTQIL